MVSDLAKSIRRTLPFAERVLEDVLWDNAELLESLVRKLYDLIVEAATFISKYVKQSPASKSRLQPCSSTTYLQADRVLKSPNLFEDRRMIKDLQGNFKRLNEDFDRAVDVEALKVASNIGGPPACFLTLIVSLTCSSDM